MVAAIADPGVKVTPVLPLRVLAVPPPLDPKVIGPAQKLVARHFPGVPLVPKTSTGATDGVYLEAIGIPVYGVHGLNERKSARSVYMGRDFLNDLIKAYADAN